VLLFSGAVLWVPFCCWLELELGLLIVPLGWVLSVPELELYWLSEVPPWLCLEAHPAATKPVSAITASIFFIVSPFTSFLTLNPAENSLNQAFTRFVA
jgi:hypothetical protein